MAGFLLEEVREQRRCQDGVLQILVPNAEEVHAKRIQVRPGKGKPAVAGSASKNGA